ncbi:hypothetical protein L198_03182 [Cryptococcus wingfieldii CBS 7118]|uniref:Uncharacterized protein n=1 Tax=Cryptococcus wingfieldii CBS 7118 TaxID=1295528 RepID=A0A1E3JEN3_9TREE|nr:hypothetical protein L198_03182 [Cryptococcus wingfieldii CBS 7118]ODN99340.1 hypothetical protein L198_03182 [Cryptococcus wingfieldii CBS 7118]
MVQFTGFSGASLDPIEGVEYVEVKVPPIKWRNDVTKRFLTLRERSDDLEKQRVRSISAKRRQTLRGKEKKKAAEAQTQAETAQSGMGDDEMASSSRQLPDYPGAELDETYVQQSLGSCGTQTTRGLSGKSPLMTFLTLTRRGYATAPSEIPRVPTNITVREPF